MRIVVTQLTRMRESRICIAGIEPETQTHVRPVTLRGDQITRSLLSEEGGSLCVGAVVDLGEVQARPSPPETEDHVFKTKDLRLVEVLRGDDFLELLTAVSDPDLETAFGPDLERRGDWKYAMPVGSGHRSLAVVWPKRRPRLAIDDRFGKLQLRFDDPDRATYLPVTDARFFESDQKTIKAAVVEDVRIRLRQIPSALMLGLARPYRAQNDDCERHWLQLNGLVLRDQPVGNVP